ncbi:Uncharacterised protein [Edwardsiella hoshinae]|uniref:Phage tail fibre repeat n=1 Tax=Edwardsiella hoshinae TaxID=93378 RepID=A0A376IY96_9GAMM|nr:hypothetical protein [Edwardsiella hoshinae]STE53366.1 Uncharacterised protein [Edwardsiella hoshinae]
MHRIDTPTAQKDKFGVGKNGFTRGNPQTGTPSTDLDDDYFDSLQEEIAGVIEAAAISLDKADRGQLLKAMKKLFQSGDETLTALASLATGENKLPYFTGNKTAGQTELTQVGRDLIGKASTDAVLEYLGLRETINQAAGALQKAQNGADIPNKSKFIDNTGLRDTVNKANNAVPTSRRINNKALSSDISLTASDVSAFALGRTGAAASNDKAVPWNAPSGIYLANIGGASCMILHFNMGTGSCPSVQFKINCKNGGVAYRSARDGYGFESDWVELMPATKTVQDIRLSTREQVKVWNGPGYGDQPPYVITGVLNSNRDEFTDTGISSSIAKTH